MIKNKQECLNLIRILLIIIGLWPYQQSNFTTFQYIFVYGVMIAFITFQLTMFLTSKCTLDLLSKILSSVSLFIFCVIKYNVFHFNRKNIKNLLMHLQDIYNKLEDKNEIDIMRKYDYTAKCYTIALISKKTFIDVEYNRIANRVLYGICTIIVHMLFQYWINMADVALSINESRSYYFSCNMEYFIDEQNYFYLITLHINTAYCLAAFIIIGSGTTIIMVLLYICGLFKIASYRVEHAININIERNISLRNIIFMTKGIAYAVDIQRQGVRLSKYLMLVLKKMNYWLIICLVICLSLNLFQIALSKTNIKDVLMPFGYACVCVMYMFLANLMGQFVSDHNNHVFITTYNVQWYRTPLHIQKMILFMLQIGTKKYYLDIGGVFSASIEGFATLVKASISYFTVIHSTQ